MTRRSDLAPAAPGPSEWGEPVEGVPIVHEDARVLVVDKPPGLLSQPGRQISDSVVERVRAARPEARGPLMMHRLDMDTSGLLVLAKDPDAHRLLSGQFERRDVVKRYRARLERPPRGLGGCIRLPLRLDRDDRPRQIVCLERGRASTTLWRRAAGACDVVFMPLSGRTHQLRVHAADPRGLDAPIGGDRLYGPAGAGPPAGRLMLHAEYLAFTHPDGAHRQICHSVVPFERPRVRVNATTAAERPGERP